MRSVLKDPDDRLIVDAVERRKERDREYSARLVSPWRHVKRKNSSTEQKKKKSNRKKQRERKIKETTELSDNNNGPVSVPFETTA
jgi:hypothetical protein